MPERSTARILILSDYPLAREGLNHLIHRADGLMVCGERGLAGAEPACLQLRPQLVVLELFAPGLGAGLALVGRLKGLDPQLRVLVVADGAQAGELDRARLAGADGLLSKREESARILEVLRRVLGGASWFREAPVTGTCACRERAPAQDGTCPCTALSRRETEIFEMIGRGIRTGTIARRLGISVKTVESHRENIKRKLELGSGGELTRCAMRWMLQGHLAHEA